MSTLGASHPVWYKCPFRKVLFYISCMFAFKRAASRAHDRESLREKMTMVPNRIVDGLIARFTETTRGSTKYVGIVSNVQIH